MSGMSAKSMKTLTAHMGLSSGFVVFSANGTRSTVCDEVSDVFAFVGKVDEVPLVLESCGFSVKCWCGAKADYVREASFAANAGFVCNQHIYDFYAGMYRISTV